MSWKGRYSKAEVAEDRSSTGPRAILLTARMPLVVLMHVLGLRRCVRCSGRWRWSDPERF